MLVQNFYRDPSRAEAVDAGQDKGQRTGITEKQVFAHSHAGGPTAEVRVKVTVGALLCLSVNGLSKEPEGEGQYERIKKCQA